MAMLQKLVFRQPLPYYLTVKMVKKPQMASNAIWPCFSIWSNVPEMEHFSSFTVGQYRRKGQIATPPVSAISGSLSPALGLFLNRSVPFAETRQEAEAS